MSAELTLLVKNNTKIMVHLLLSDWSIFFKCANRTVVPLYGCHTCAIYRENYGPGFVFIPSGSTLTSPSISLRKAISSSLKEGLKKQKPLIQGHILVTDTKLESWAQALESFIISVRASGRKGHISIWRQGQGMLSPLHKDCLTLFWVWGSHGSGWCL